MPASRLPAELIPAVGYLRVSQGREEMISPELQRGKIIPWARENRRRIVHWVEDLDDTGRNFDRDVMRAIGYVQSGEAREILLYRFDRWGRNATECLVNVKLVEKLARGRVISVTEPFDATTAVGKYTRTNAFAIAELQSDIIGDNWRDVLASRVARALPGTGGPRFGYVRLGRVRREDDPKRFRSDPEAGPERYEVDPVSGPVLGEMYRRYIAGDGRSALLRWVNGTGVTTVRGKPFGWRSLFLVLDSGFGAGLLRVHDPDCRCGGNLGQRCRNAVFYTGSQPPVIEMEEWRGYTARREDMRPRGPRSNDPSYPLSGLATCGLCRHRLSISYGMGRPGFGYRCQQWVQHQGCPGVWVQRTVLEDTVKAEVAKWATDIDAAGTASMEREAARERARADVAGLEREIVRLERMLAKSVKDQAADEVTPASVYESARKDIAAERAERLEALQAARRADTVTASDLVPVAAGILEAWGFLPPARLREALKKLIREVRVTRTGVRTPPKIEVIPVWEPER